MPRPRPKGAYKHDGAPRKPNLIRPRTNIKPSVGRFFRPDRATRFRRTGTLHYRARRFERTNARFSKTDPTERYGFAPGRKCRLKTTESETVYAGIAKIRPPGGPHLLDHWSANDFESNDNGKKKRDDRENRSS